MKLKHTSDETKQWVKERRLVWWKSSGIGLFVSIATIIGFRDQISAQLDWFVTAFHGPSILLQQQQSIITMTNNVQRIEWHQQNMDKRLGRIENKLGISEFSLLTPENQTNYDKHSD